MKDLTVLLVEDEVLIALDLEEKLSESGLKVIRTTRGEEGVRLAIAELPDVIVLDLGLPDIHGLEVIRRLEAEGLHIPTIVLTGMRDHDTKHEARMHQVSAYLEKPFDPRVLVARIHIVSGSVRTSSTK
jgi:DNA-binding response OmpR family regulator